MNAPGRRILIVDDHPDGAEAFRDFLRILGHEADIAATGEDGLRRIRETRPEIVFCDWRLPGICGPDVARAVRSDPRIAATFLVSLTALDDEEVREGAVAAGFDVHLVKPPDLAGLERLIERAGASPRAAEPKAQVP